MLGAMSNTGPTPLPLEPPTTDDRAIWDLWLSQWQLPVVLVAEELGLFARLNRAAATLDELRAEFNLAERPAEALLAVLCAMGFCARRNGRFHIADVARSFLLRDGHYFWGGMLRGVGTGGPGTERLMAALHKDNRGPQDRVTRVWEAGETTEQGARDGNRSMQSHSFPAAMGMARNASFAGVRRLLDVAGGSGCYAIALALRHPELHCTVAELDTVAADTQRYIDRYGVAGQVDTHAFNMFQNDWPTGYDAIFFSNVFHDWDSDRCRDLAHGAFKALPPGGRIYLHEMLLNDSKDGPLTPALFSLLMLVGTRGKQFSGRDIEEMLSEAGFGPVSFTQTYGYYSLAVASKP